MNSKRTLLLIGLFVGMFFANLDQTVVGTAMPRIIGDLNGLAIFAWVTIAYMLTSTVIVPLAGKLADLFGRRMVYVAGVAIFMIGSALCGTSGTMTELILYRGLQGLGAGVMMPMVLTIVGDIFPPDKIGRWQGIFGGVMTLASIVGPTIGGLLVDNATWHWVFYVNMPFGLIAMLCVFFGLKDEVRRTGKVKLDYAGALSFIIGTTSLLLGISLGGHDYAWDSWQIIGMLAAGLVFLVAFVFIERRAAEPILSLDLFKNRAFSISNIVGLLTGFGMFGSITFLPLFLQGAVGISATGSGNILMPMMISMIVAMLIGGQLVSRVTFRSLFILGMTLISGAFLLLSTMSLSVPPALAIVYIVILGLGLGFVMPTSNVLAQTIFPAAQRGVATSAGMFARSMGATLGVAVLSIVLNAHSSELLKTEFVPKLQAISTTVPAAQAGAINTMLEEAGNNPQGLFNQLLNPQVAKMMPEAMKTTILPPLKDALAQSVRLVFLVAMFIGIAGIIASFFLGNTRMRKPERKSEDNDDDADSEGNASTEALASPAI